MFSQNMVKVLADAKKLGVVDSKTEILLKDYVRTLQSEISKKSESVQRTLGEISALRKQEDIFVSLIKNHITVEQRQVDMRINREQMDDDLDIEIDDAKKSIMEINEAKPTKKKKTKRKTSFVGDKSNG